MKRRGLITCLFGALCLLGGLASGWRELFLLAAICLTLLLLALLQAALQTPRLRLDLGSAQVIRGQAKTLRLQLSNPRPWPLFPLRLRLSLLREGQAATELAALEILLPPRAEKTLEIEAICPHRGEYQVLTHRFYAEDIFGFFALPGPALPPQSLLALPRLDLIPLAEQDFTADEDEQNWQGLLGPAGLLAPESRAYLPGDSPGAIHWKKSASRRTLFSRLREQATDFSCCLLLDGQPCAEEALALDYEDRLTEAALCFLFTRLTSHQAITLLPGGLTLQSAQGLEKAAAYLAALPFRADDAYLEIKSLLEGSRLPDTLFLLLAQPPLRLVSLLEQLTNRNCAVVLLAPAADAALVEAELNLNLPLLSIDAPQQQANWLEV